MKRKSLFFVFFIVLGCSVIAQSISIKGTVVDAVDGEPLSYCNCFLKNSNVGTATGLDGRFDIKTRPENLPDSLTIQYIGYESRTLAVSKKGTNFGKIALTPRNTELKDVVVKSKPRNWNKTLKGVFDSCIYKTYPTPCVSTVYYKESAGFEGKKIDKTEVAVNVLFPKKNSRSMKRDWMLFGNCGTADESYFVTGLRKYEQGKLVLHPEETPNYYGIFDCNSLTQLLNNNVYFYRNVYFEKMAAKAMFRLVKIDTIDGNTVYTIEGQFNEKDKSTTELSISFDETHKTIYNYYLKNTTATKNGGQVTYSETYNYRVTNGLAIPLYFRFQTTEQDSKNAKVFTICNEALFSDTRLPNEKESLGKESNTKNSFEFQGITYDKEFWDNYTIVE